MGITNIMFYAEGANTPDFSINSFNLNGTW